jgi:hypothetical protein
MTVLNPDSARISANGNPTCPPPPMTQTSRVNELMVFAVLRTAKNTRKPAKDEADGRLIGL